MNIDPYFGLTRSEYLQRLGNRWGDFKVSWNFTDENGELAFSKQRTVIQMVEEKRSLEQVMHRQAMPREIFIEIDDSPLKAAIKLNKATSFAKRMQIPYCIFKSRKGYHISVLDRFKVTSRKKMIEYVGSDSQFIGPKGTWSLEWSNHWKQKDFVILPVEMSPDYPRTLLGNDIL